VRGSGGVGHMHDQRVVGWAAFGDKNLCYGSGIVGIGSQPIDGFGWQA